MTEKQMESDLIRLGETVKGLVDKVGLLDILIRKQAEEMTMMVNKQPVESPQPENLTKKFIQINANHKTYLCSTAREQQIFSENNPGVEMESFNIELTAEQADRYLKDPENKKQFIKKVKKET